MPFANRMGEAWSEMHLVIVLALEMEGRGEQLLKKAGGFKPGKEAAHVEMAPVYMEPGKQTEPPSTGWSAPTSGTLTG